MAQGAKKAAQAKAADSYRFELAGRISKAFKTHNANAKNGKELSQEEFAALVSRELGLSDKDAYSQTAVSRWMSSTRPTIPEPRTLQVIAKVLGADLMWLT
jgi:hypothetical protein